MQMIAVNWTPEKSRSIGAWISMFASLFALIGAGSAAVGLDFGETPPAKPPGESPSQSKGTSVLSAPITKGTFKGRIINAETGKPVEGARLRVRMEGISGRQSWLEPVSDKDGQFSQEMPLGELTPSGLFPPFGYYFLQPKIYETLVLTKNKPVIVQNYSLNTGTSWKVELANFSGSKDNPPLLIWFAEPLQADPFGIKDFCWVVANAQGEAVLTVPPDRKEYGFRCDQRESPERYEIPEVQLLMDKGFDPAKIQGDPKRVAGCDSVRLKDHGGNTATLNGAEVVIRGGQAIIRFPCKSIPASRAFQAEGTIQDEMGKPICGAKVTAAFITKNTKHWSHMSNLVANSGADGKFIMPTVLLPAHYFSGCYQVEMVITKSDRSAVETKPLELLDVQKTKVANFGVIALRPGKTLKGRAIDWAGNAIEGAVIRPHAGGVFAHRHLTCRSDAEGRFQIPELAYGKIKLWASYRDREANEEVNFDANSGEITLTMRPPRSGNSAPFPPADVGELAILLAELIEGVLALPAEMGSLFGEIS